MKVLDLFIEPVGTPVVLRTNPNSDVMSYSVFIRQWNQGTAGAHTVGTWLPEELESPQGASMTMDGGTGYDFILMASLRPGGQAAISVDLKFQAPGAGSFDEPVALPSSEGPVVERTWKVILRQA
jgi:hypothetical protein